MEHVNDVDGSHAKNYRRSALQQAYEETQLINLTFDFTALFLGRTQKACHFRTWQYS